MKLFRLFLTTLIFEMSNYIGFSQTNQDTIIIWSPNNKLKAVDFKGIIPKVINKRAAASMLQIKTETFITDKLPNFKIVPLFYKNGSWIKDSSSFVLIHEQLHFDIAELFARKMRKRINELRSSKVNNYKIYHNTLLELWQDFDKESDAYDTQTLHGVNYLKQKEWNDGIAKQLEKLKKFKVDYF